MATKKSNKSNKSNKTKSTKPTAEQSAAKSTAKSAEVETTEKAVVETTKTENTSTSSSSSKQKSCFKGFFARKYEEKESILTVFKKPKFYGALLGEVIGTMLLAFLFFSIMLMGIASTATYAVAIVAILIAVYAFSGACLNPIITVGMMASRRMSVIRGIMYIIAEIVGAWLGWLVFNAFHLAGGETAYDIASISAIGEGGFWITAMVEFIGGIIIAFFFSRALKYKRSVFTFAITVTGGIVLAVLLGYVVSAAFLSLNNNFIYNPAMAMMLQIFPTAGENFGEILGGIFQALSAYAIIPLIGGVLGFYLSDFTARLSGEE
ncbi:aquaporin [Candidatus Saccharibacteria bacterium]|nr:aquaporin [Candidatus Saccharibacteria bacterium]